MEIVKKNDYGKYEMNGFKLNQKVFFNRKNKESRISAIDTSGNDSFVFFVEDAEGDFLRRSIVGYRTEKSLNKNGTWCTRREISRIANPTDDKAIGNDIKKGDEDNGKS